jgi:hypothetical protein
MSVGFRAVQWNRDKLVYDGLLLAAVALYGARSRRRMGGAAWASSTRSTYSGSLDSPALAAPAATHESSGGHPL